MRLNRSGFLSAELLLWLGFVLIGTYTVQVKVTRFWNRQGQGLQKERIPYTGRLSWKKN